VTGTAPTGAVPAATAAADGARVGRCDRVLAVVLAAGEGSRFRGDSHKLLAPLRGRPVVAWAYDHASSAGLDGVIVVAGAADVRPFLPADATVVDNPAWSCGQAGSLQVARRYAEVHGYDAMVIGLGDQPFVPAATWRLIGRSREDLVAAVLEGQRSPPVRIARSLWALLPDHGDEGARVLMRSRPDLLIEIACPGKPVDIDTVEDLQTWS